MIWNAIKENWFANCWWGNAKQMFKKINFLDCESEQAWHRGKRKDDRWGRWRMALIVLICIQQLNYIKAEHWNRLCGLYAWKKSDLISVPPSWIKRCFKSDLCSFILIDILVLVWHSTTLLQIESSKWLTASTFFYEAILPKMCYCFFLAEILL